MKLIIIACLVAIATAIDLWMWENEDECGGYGGVCRGIAQQQCCYGEIPTGASLYGSAGAESGNGFDVMGPWTKQGNSYCAFQVAGTARIPVCFLMHLGSTISGVTWEHRDYKAGAKEVEELTVPTVEVEAETFWSDGSKAYVISHEKMALVRSAKPTNRTELAEFYKMHADVIIDRKADVQVLGSGR